MLRSARAAAASLEWARARREYERVASGRHRRAEGLLGIAKVQFETKDYDGAIRFAQKSLKAGGGDSARLQLGHAYFKKRRYNQAITFYEAVLRRSPNNKEAKLALREARKKARR